MSNDKYTSAHISNVDKLIDALDEIEPKLPPTYFECSSCGGTDYESRSPLGGPKIRVCTKCGNKTFRGRANISPLLPENLNHKQGLSRGPTVSTKKRKQDKHQPTYRGKGKKR